jgi:O-antigen ligase
MELTAAGGNLVRRVALFAAAGWGVLLVLGSKQKVHVEPLLFGSLVALGGLAAASFLWADDSGMCLRRLFAAGCCVMAALGVARAFSLTEIAWLTVLVLATLAAIGLAAELRLGTFRPWAGDYRFAGTVHPNTQGPALAALALAAAALARRGARGAAWLWVLSAIAIGLLLLTKSRTTAAGLVVSLAAVVAVRLPAKTRWIAGGMAAWAGAVFLWMVWTLGFDPATDFRDAMLLGRAEESDTLSGRAFIWPEVLDYALQRPILGYGYEAFWTPARIETISANLGWGLREAHNAYLEVLLWLGTAGLVALLAVAASGLADSIRGYRRSRDQAYLLPLGLIVFALVNAALESGMVAITVVPFLLGCCLLRLAAFDEPLAGRRSPRARCEPIRSLSADP